MNKFFSISKAANKLRIHEDDLFNLASDGVITLSWQPKNGGDGIDIIPVELVKTTDLDDLECESWIRVKGSPVMEHQYGPFQIDVSLGEIWPPFLADINSGELGATIDSFIDPLVFKGENGGFFATYFANPFAPVLPKLHELVISEDELKRYIAQLKYFESRPKPDKEKITYLRVKEIESYLKNTNSQNRVNEKSRGPHGGFKKEVKEAVINCKMEDGTFLYANLDSKEVNEENFNDAWKVVKNKYKPS